MGYSGLFLFSSFQQLFKQLTVNMFVLKFGDEWIRTVDLCKLRHNHYPR